MLRPYGTLSPRSPNLQSSQEYLTGEIFHIKNSYRPNSGIIDETLLIRWIVVLAREVKDLKQCEVAICRCITQEIYLQLLCLSVREHLVSISYRVRKPAQLRLP